MDPVDVVCGVYVLLTAAKISQLLLTVAARRQKKKKEGMEYAPSLQVIMFILDNVLVRGEVDIAKVPRKIFRDITDPWLQDYTKRINKNKGKEPRVFTNLKDAMNTFYREFCNDTSSFMVHWISNSSVLFLNQPLGLQAVLSLSYYVAVSPIMLFREVSLGGNALTLICKMAAGSTMNEVYVVACKEQLPFEEALAKYPWATRLFSRKQVHAMIGRAACPLYKRELPFPVKEDIMDFDYDVIDSVMAKLRQRHNSILGNLRESLDASHILLAAMILYLCYLDAQELSWIWTIAPYASIFYPVRVFVDRMLGIQWHASFRYCL